MLEYIAQANLTKLMSYLPIIRKDIKQWKVIEIILEQDIDPEKDGIIDTLKTFWAMETGVIFLFNRREVMAIIKVGLLFDPSEMKHGLGSMLPDYRFKVQTKGLTTHGIDSLQIRIVDIMRAQQKAGGSIEAEQKSDLFRERALRKTQKFLIVDDDIFMRSMVKKVAKDFGEVFELDDPEKIDTSYAEVNPDIVFLDVHFPGKSGFDSVSNILAVDKDAHIVILTADGTRDNIIKTKELRAKGFIVKPFTREKLQEAIGKVETVASKTHVA